MSQRQLIYVDFAFREKSRHINLDTYNFYLGCYLYIIFEMYLDTVQILRFYLDFS